MTTTLEQSAGLAQDPNTYELATGDTVNTIPSSVTLAATMTEQEQVNKATIVVTEHKEITCMGSSCSKDALNVTQPAEMTDKSTGWQMIDIHLPTMGTSVFMLAILVIVFCSLCLCYHKIRKRLRRSSDHREIRRLRKAQREQEMDNLQHLVPSASKGTYRPAPQTPQDNLTKAIQQVL